MLRITDNGNSEYVIIIRKNHSASEKTAAEELAAYLKKDHRCRNTGKDGRREEDRS